MTVVDSSDDVFVAGTFEASIDFGGGSMSGPSAGSSSYNIFIAKLDSGGAYLHQMNTSTASSGSTVTSMATDTTGNVFLTGGNYSDSVNLGGGAMTPSGNSDILLGALDGALGYNWAKDIGFTSTVSVWGNALALDPTGGIVIGGVYGGNGTVNFGQGALPTGGQGVFVVRFDSSGNELASWGQAPSSSYTTLAGLAYVSWPDFVIGGVTTAPFTPPSGTLSAGAYVARLPP